jgi:sugar O-acyltransferase (sialic acid O-acetyltransferase NeuD family)
MPSAQRRTRQRPVVILGAGHQGRNIHDILTLRRVPVLGFLDDTKPPGGRINGVKVLGGFALARDAALLRRAAFIVGIGDNRIRCRLFDEIIACGGKIASAIHPDSSISPSARLGRGVYVQAFADIRANARVDDFALIEGAALVGADVTVGKAASVGPGSQLTARASLGEGAFVGAGVAVIGPAGVGDYAVVGAGAVVIGDVPSGVLAVGVPSRIRHTRQS